jgi:hypothetical protein
MQTKPRRELKRLMRRALRESKRHSLDQPKRFAADVNARRGLHGGDISAVGAISMVPQRCLFGKDTAVLWRGTPSAENDASVTGFGRASSSAVFQTDALSIIAETIRRANLRQLMAIACQSRRATGREQPAPEIRLVTHHSEISAEHAVILRRNVDDFPS